MPRTYASLLLALALSATACGEENDDTNAPEGDADTDTDADADADSDADADADADADSDVQVSHAAEIQPIWDLHCSSCHGGGAPSSGLDLSGDAWDDLVGAPSGQARMALVTPGDVGASYLAYKLRGTQADASGSGVQMPRGGAPLDEATLDLIETWIAEGALE